MWISSKGKDSICTITKTKYKDSRYKSLVEREKKGHFPLLSSSDAANPGVSKTWLSCWTVTPTCGDVTLRSSRLPSFPEQFTGKGGQGWARGPAWFILGSGSFSRQMRLPVRLLPITSQKYSYPSPGPRASIYLFGGNRNHKCKFS